MSRPDFGLIAKNMRPDRTALEHVVKQVRAVFPDKKCRYDDLLRQLVSLQRGFNILPDPDKIERHKRMLVLIDEARRGNVADFRALLLEWLWIHHRSEAEQILQDNGYADFIPNEETAFASILPRRGGPNQDISRDLQLLDYLIANGSLYQMFVDEARAALFPDHVRQTAAFMELRSLGLLDAFGIDHDEASPPHASAYLLNEALATDREPRLVAAILALALLRHPTLARKLLVETGIMDEGAFLSKANAVARLIASKSQSALDKLSESPSKEAAEVFNSLLPPLTDVARQLLRHIEQKTRRGPDASYLTPEVFSQALAELYGYGLLEVDMSRIAPALASQSLSPFEVTTMGFMESQQGP